MKYFKLVLPVVVFFSLLLSGCNSGGNIKNEPVSTVLPNKSDPQIIKTKTYEGVILMDSTLSTWRPDTESITVFEKGLANSLQLYYRQSDIQYDDIDFVIKNLSKYKRQYFGTTYKGKNVLYCNFITDNSMDLQWKEKYIVVMDGGANFFSIKYDPETYQYYDLSINGHA